MSAWGHRARLLLNLFSTAQATKHSPHPGTSQRLDGARGRCLGFSFKFKKLTWKVWRGMKSFLLSLRRPRPRLHNFYPFQRVLWTVNSMELAQRKTTKCLNFTFLAVQDIAIGDLEPWYWGFATDSVCNSCDVYYCIWFHCVGHLTSSFFKPWLGLSIGFVRKSKLMCSIDDFVLEYRFARLVICFGEVWWGGRPHLRRSVEVWWRVVIRS